MMLGRKRSSFMTVPLSSATERAGQASVEEVLVNDVMAQRGRRLIGNDVVPSTGTLARLADAAQAERPADPPAPPAPGLEAEPPAVDLDLELELDVRAGEGFAGAHAAGGIVNIDELRLALESAIVVQVEESLHPPVLHPLELPLLAVPPQDLLAEQIFMDEGQRPAEDLLDHRQDGEGDAPELAGRERFPLQRLIVDERAQPLG